MFPHFLRKTEIVDDISPYISSLYHYTHIHAHTYIYNIPNGQKISVNTLFIQLGQED